MAKRKKKPYQPSFDETWRDDYWPKHKHIPGEFSVFGVLPGTWDFTPYVNADWTFLDVSARCHPVTRLHRMMDYLADKRGTWYGFLWSHPKALKAFAGTYINGQGFVYNKILYPMDTARRRCNNCKLGLLAHRDKHCMYETTTFEPTNLPVYDVKTGKRLTLEELWALSSSGT